MPGVYRLEYSSSRRAGCRNAECKKADIKIEKDELRFGTLVPFEDKQSWHWKHWGCTTPQQITSLKGVIEGNLEYLDGYEDLTFDDQVKVQRALENGHVDDEDWKGDVERNRPGKKGFRTPAYILQQQDDENEDGSPSKRTPKKRGRAKDNDNGVEDEVQKPAAKKSKAATQKAKKGKAEEADSQLGDETLPPKKARVQLRKVNEEERSEVEVPPPKKARGQNRKIKAEDGDEASAVTNGDPDATPTLEAAPKRTRLPRKAAEVMSVYKGDDKDELDEEMVEEVPRSKLGRRKAGANGAAKTAKAVTKAGAIEVQGAKKGTAKGPRTKGA